MRKWNIGIKVILGLVVLSFIIFYAGNFAGLDRRDRSIYMATVGKENIDFTEFQNTYKLVKQQQEQMYNQAGRGELSPEMDQFFRQQTIQGLVDRKLILMEARKAGMTASDQEVQKAILKYPFFLRNGSFVGYDEYSRMVDMVFHMSTEKFEQSVAEDIILDKYNDMLTAGLLVTDQEIEQEYRKNNLTAKIDYVPFEISPAPSEQPPKPEEVRAYYDAHKDEFKTGELRKVQYLLISHQSEKNKVQIPEAKLKEYYDSNKERYSRPEQVAARHILLKTEGKDEAAVKAQAEDLVKQLRSGAEFAALARQYSDDPGSKENGGDLGLFERGRMVPEFEQAAFTQPVNAIGDPVKTQFGYHIIQVTARQPAYQMDFALVKDQIFRQLAQPQEIKNAEEQAKRIYDDMTKNKKSMADISKVQLVQMKTTDYFSQQQPPPGISPAFAQKTFEMKNKNDISEPVQMFQDYAIVQLIDTRASELEPFEKVQPKATQKYNEVRAAEMANQKAQAFYEAVGAMGDL
jgi:peptidyl-prolyl cis-trans isomerase D